MSVQEVAAKRSWKQLSDCQCITGMARNEVENPLTQNKGTKTDSKNI